MAGEVVWICCSKGLTEVATGKRQSWKIMGGQLGSWSNPFSYHCASAIKGKATMALPVTL